MSERRPRSVEIVSDQLADQISGELSGQEGQIRTGISRYDRQQLITGWDQEKLSSARMVIIGSDVLANYLAMNAAALGFGTIEICGQGIVDSIDLAQDFKNYSKGFSLFKNGTKANLIAEFAQKLNPAVKTRGLNLNLASIKNIQLIEKPDIIIEASSSINSKANAIKYSRLKNIPLISVGCGPNIGKLGVYNPGNSMSRSDEVRYLENILFHDIIGSQGTIVSSVMSSLAVDEARKILMPINNEKTIEDILLYNLSSLERFAGDAGDAGDTRGETGGTHKLNYVQEREDFSDKKVLMIGAGALGNFAGLELVLNGIGNLTIVDDDTIEETNLNRQIFFYDKVGAGKAETLASRLGQLNSNVNVDYLVERITPESENVFKKGGYDLIVDTVDNNKSRALLNYFSLKYKIPLISGGTRYNSGQVVVSVPGETACLNCKVDIDKLAVDGHQPQSCIHAAQPSVITSNQIIGGMIVGEVRSVLRPDKYGICSNKISKYISEDEFRIGDLPALQTCECSKNKRKLRSWMKKMKYLYE